MKLRGNIKLQSIFRSMQIEYMTNPPHNRVANLLRGSSSWLSHSKLLVVGVGGIGCEVLKVLCKLEVGQIHILDMDTIQLSNLNRQFLFKAEHKGMSKSLVAKQSVQKLNPHLDIQAHHCNIKELPLSFFTQFQFIVMALDNVQARNYVNKIGVRLNIPIVDAGTLGYKGNVTTILRGVSKCYSCQPKNAPQNVFPVCTIRMRPDKPIHCIVWAKMLFQAMFAGNPEQDANEMSDLASLQNEAEVTILHKLFNIQIQNIRNAKAEGDTQMAEKLLKNIRSIPEQVIANNSNRKIIDQFMGHQKVQSIEENIALFVQSIGKLREQKKLNGRVVFEKDDDEVMHFVAAAANLRMHCFTIQQQTFHQVKNMAGNIIPAIASTNAIVSALQLIQILKQISNQRHRLRSYFVQNQHSKLLALKLQPPLPSCVVCSSSATPVCVECNFNQYKLSQLVSLIEENSPSLSEYSINQGSKEIYNSDEPKQSLLCKTIWQIAESYELDLILTDEETSSKLCILWLVHNDNLSTPKATNLQKLIPIKLEVQKVVEQPLKQDDDDIVMVAEDSEQVQIVGCSKRERKEQAEMEQEGPRKLKKPA